MIAFRWTLPLLAAALAVPAAAVDLTDTWELSAPARARCTRAAAGTPALRRAARGSPPRRVPPSHHCSCRPRLRTRPPNSSGRRSRSP